MSILRKIEKAFYESDRVIPAIVNGIDEYASIRTGKYDNKEKLSADEIEDAAAEVINSIKKSIK